MKVFGLWLVVIVVQESHAIVPITAMGNLLKTAPVALKALHDMVTRASDTGNKYWLDKHWVTGNLGTQPSQSTHQNMEF